MGRILPLLLLVLILTAQARPVYPLNFVMTEGPGLASLRGGNPGLYAQVMGGYGQAAATWGSAVSTNVTVSIYVDYANIGTPLAQARTTYINTSYAAYRSALLTAADPDSLTDAAAAGSLPSGMPAYTMRNEGITVAAQNVRLSTALGKALGFRTSPLFYDGALTFNSRYSYDFDSADGIAAGRYDFAGIAMHEIGHILGFTSAVDDVDELSSGIVTPHAMDMWRFGQDGRRDLSTGGMPYFAPDGAPSNMLLSTGVRQGDGRQASHWKAGTGGLMRPEVGTGQAFTLTEKDSVVLDAMGWTLSRNSPPTASEPSGGLLMLFLLLPMIRLAYPRPPPARLSLL